MKYRVSYWPASEQPYQIEEDVWEFQWEPDCWVVTMTKERDSDDQLMKDIVDYYTKNGTWAISNMIFFYNKNELILFKLKWC